MTTSVIPRRLKGHVDFQDRIVFFDTPGFDDPSVTPAKILQEISNWLKQTYVWFGYGFEYQI